MSEMQNSPLLVVRDVHDYDEIPHNFLAQFANETALQLHFTDLTSFNAQVLQHLRTLTDFVLQLDCCEVLEESIFESCPALLTLTLIVPQLNHVPARLFESLRRLEELRVRFGPIDTLPKTLFGSCSHLLFLRLEIPTILLPETIFHGLSELLHLSLHFSDADTETGEIKSMVFNSEHFKPLKYLKIVQMFRMSFVLPPSTFRYNARLQVLELHNCKMSLDPAKKSVLDNLPFLRGLDLSFNNLHDLKTVLKTNTRLEKLALNNNQLKVLARKNFRNLSSLKVLFLHNNEIRVLKNNCFAYFRLIVFIDLSKNELKTIDAKVFVGLNHLKHLNLSQNRLKTLDGNLFARLKSLRELILHSNSLHGAKLKCGQVHDLNLSSNSLTTVYLNDRYAVRRLNLSNNQISDLIRLQLKHLVVLNCSRNSIRQLDDFVLRDLRMLRSIDFGSNKLSSLPEKLFNSCEYLEELYMRNNLLTFVPEKLLEKQHLLKIADFGVNSLFELAPHTFSRTDSLETLYLDNNCLTKLHPDTFKMLPLLTTLSLKRNSFVDFDRKLFQWNYCLNEVELDREVATKPKLDTSVVVVATPNKMADDSIETASKKDTCMGNRIVSADVTDKLSEIIGSGSWHDDPERIIRAEIHEERDKDSDIEWINDVRMPDDTESDSWIDNVPMPNTADYAVVNKTVKKKPLSNKPDDCLDGGFDQHYENMANVLASAGQSADRNRYETKTEDSSSVSCQRNLMRIAQDKDVAGVMDAWARIRHRVNVSISDSSFLSD